MYAVEPSASKTGAVAIRPAWPRRISRSDPVSRSRHVDREVVPGRQERRSVRREPDALDDRVVAPIELALVAGRYVHERHGAVLSTHGERRSVSGEGGRVQVVPTKCVGAGRDREQGLPFLVDPDHREHASVTRHIDGSTAKSAAGISVTVRSLPSIGSRRTSTMRPSSQGRHSTVTKEEPSDANAVPIPAATKSAPSGSGTRWILPVVDQREHRPVLERGPGERRAVGADVEPVLLGEPRDAIQLEALGVVDRDAARIVGRREDRPIRRSLDQEHAVAGTGEDTDRARRLQQAREERACVSSESSSS